MSSTMSSKQYAALAASLSTGAVLQGCGGGDTAFVEPPPAPTQQQCASFLEEDACNQYAFENVARCDWDDTPIQEFCAVDYNGQTDLDKIAAEASIILHNNMPNAGLDGTGAREACDDIGAYPVQTCTSSCVKTFSREVQFVMNGELDAGEQEFDSALIQSSYFDRGDGFFFPLPPDAETAPFLLAFHWPSQESVDAAAWAAVSGRPDYIIGAQVVNRDRDAFGNITSLTLQPLDDEDWPKSDALPEGAFARPGRRDEIMISREQLEDENNFFYFYDEYQSWMSDRNCGVDVSTGFSVELEEYCAALSEATCDVAGSWPFQILGSVTDGFDYTDESGTTTPINGSVRVLAAGAKCDLELSVDPETGAEASACVVTPSFQTCDATPINWEFGERGSGHANSANCREMYQESLPGKAEPLFVYTGEEPWNQAEPQTELLKRADHPDLESASLRGCLPVENGDDSDHPGVPDSLLGNAQCVFATGFECQVRDIGILPIPAEETEDSLVNEMCNNPIVCAYTPQDNGRCEDKASLTDPEDGEGEGEGEDTEPLRA